MSGMGEYPNLTKCVRVKLNEQLGEHGGGREVYLPNVNRKIRFKADDCIIMDDKHEIFIEIEETQCHPDTNVSKYWMYLEENKDKNIILIQFFGREFSIKQNYLSRLMLCKFIADKIENENVERFKYYRLQSIEEKYIDSDYKNKVDEIADEIVKSILKIYNNSKLKYAIK